MISRTSSMPVCEAASISITSICRPSAIARHGSHTLHGVIVGPPCPSGPMQLSALAISRAVEVLPTPRTPVSRKAWAMRPRSIALASVFTIASWPISSAKVCGRYLRASTRYGDARRVRRRRFVRKVEAQAGRFGVVHHCEWFRRSCSSLRAGGSRNDPKRISLWLLPSGSDQVGDSLVRPTSAARIWVEAGRACKFIVRAQVLHRRFTGRGRPDHALREGALMAVLLILARCRRAAPSPQTRRSRSPAMPGRRSSARWASRSAPARWAMTRSPCWFNQADRNRDGVLDA